MPSSKKIYVVEVIKKKEMIFNYSPEIFNSFGNTKE